MNIMKCIAIDDEPLALQILEQFCKRLGGLELETYSDPAVGLLRVNSVVPDVLFLDIEMNGISGLDIAKRLPAGVFLVFTTAYAKFAVDGFDLNAVDFLHKPFSFLRFKKAVDRVMELKKLYEQSETKSAVSQEITVRAEYKNVRLSVNSITYIEAMDSYVKIYTDSGRPVITQMSMKSVMEILSGYDFVRIHKSFIVPRNKISMFSRNRVTVKGMEFPVGRAYANDFLSLMADDDE